MQDLLTEELAECSEEQQEAQDMKLVQGQWRKRQEIMPLIIEEGPEIRAQTFACGVEIFLFGRVGAVSSCHFILAQHLIGR